MFIPSTIWLLTVRHGKSPFLIGKPSISIRAIELPWQTVSQNQMVISIYGEIGDGLWHWFTHSFVIFPLVMTNSLLLKMAHRNR